MPNEKEKTERRLTECRPTAQLPGLLKYYVIIQVFLATLINNLEILSTNGAVSIEIVTPLT